MRRLQDLGGEMAQRREVMRTGRDGQLSGRLEHKDRKLSQLTWRFYALKRQTTHQSNHVYCSQILPN